MRLSYARAKHYFRIKTRQLKNGAWLQISWHHGKQCLTAEIFVEGRSWIDKGTRSLARIESQSRHFYDQTPKRLIAQVRMALARGTENIQWDVPVMRRLTGNEDYV